MTDVEMIDFLHSLESKDEVLLVIRAGVFGGIAQRLIDLTGLSTCMNCGRITHTPDELALCIDAIGCYCQPCLCACEECMEEPHSDDDCHGGLPEPP